MKSTLVKANVAWLLDHHAEALELYIRAAEQFTVAKKLNKYERQDLNVCLTRIKELEEIMEEE